MENRSIIGIGGKENKDFLNGLITNHLPENDKELVYSALLTPQGKYLFDFFLFQGDGNFFLDIHSNYAKEITLRLSMYKLRSKVDLFETKLHASRGIKDPPESCFEDPRGSFLGWRKYAYEKQNDEKVNWNALRVKHCVPETGIELTQEKTFILEAGFERLNGVSFKKGCFVGQEVISRMKRKTNLRKGLTRVIQDKQVEIGTKIFNQNKPVGTLFSQHENLGIAHLNFDRANGELDASGAIIRTDPDWNHRP